VFDFNHLVTGVCMGAVLILLGLVPGLFQLLVDGTHKWLNVLSSGLISSSSDEKVAQPVWLAIAGAALIGLSVISYLSAS